MSVTRTVFEAVSYEKPYMMCLGTVEIKNLWDADGLYHAEIRARGKKIQAVIGKSDTGKFICLPDYEYATRFAELGLTEQNEKIFFLGNRLTKEDACIVANALASLKDMVSL